MRGKPKRRKSDAQNVVSQIIRKLQIAPGIALRRYHSENDKVLQRKQMLDMVKDYDRSIYATAPTSQQNDLVDRRFSTIFTAIGADLAHSKLSKSFWSHASQDAVVKSKHLRTRRSNGAFVRTNHTCFPAGFHQATFRCSASRD